MAFLSHFFELTRREDYFGFALGGTWLGFSALDLARYSGDARALELPLVSLGPEAEHDWFYLLSRLGWLQYDTQMAGLVRGFGTVTLFVCVAFVFWLVLVVVGRTPTDGGESERRRFEEWLQRQNGSRAWQRARGEGGRC